MKQLNEQEAIAFHDSGIWKDMSKEQIVAFQLGQDKLCVPFDVFHEAVEHALGRPVYTHEFMQMGRLKLEMEGKAEAPSLEAILNMIPEGKRILIKL